MSRKEKNRIRQELKTTIVLLGSASPDLEIEQIVEATMRRCPDLIAQLAQLLIEDALRDLSRKLMHQLVPTDVQGPIQLPLGIEAPACDEWLAIPKNPAKMNGRCIYRNRHTCSPSDLRLHLALRDKHIAGEESKRAEVADYLKHLEDHLPADKPNGCMLDVIATAAEVASS